MALIILFVLFIGGGWLIGKIIGNIIFPKSNDDFDYKPSNYKEPPTIINNYKTENHLHISKEDLKTLSEKDK